MWFVFLAPASFKKETLPNPHHVSDVCLRCLAHSPAGHRLTGLVAQAGGGGPSLAVLPQLQQQVTRAQVTHERGG